MTLASWEPLGLMVVVNLSEPGGQGSPEALSQVLMGTTGRLVASCSQLAVEAGWAPSPNCSTSSASERDSCASH